MRLLSPETKRRFTSRPFLMAIVDVIKNVGAVVLVMNPNVPEAKVNAIIALAVATSALLGVFIGAELNKDAKIATGSTPETVNVGSAENVTTGSTPATGGALTVPAAEWPDTLRRLRGETDWELGPLPPGAMVINRRPDAFDSEIAELDINNRGDWVDSDEPLPMREVTL